MKRWQRRTLGVLATGGGAIGIAISMMQVAQIGWSFSLLFLAMGMALYAWGMACGVALLESQPRAEHANFWFWLVQVPIFTSPIATYFFSAGAVFLVKVDFWPLGIHWNAFLGSQFSLQVGMAQPYGFGINFLALGICYWLWRWFDFRPAPGQTIGTGAASAAEAN